MGGVGKTELAIQYSLLHLQLHSYPGGICWLRAREEDIGLQIIQFARTDLGLQPPEDLELPEQVRWCWQNWQRGNTLIVFDDVNNYSQIKPYLPPQSSQFKVLITTRLQLNLAGSHFLEVLSETDALLLLAQLIGEEKQNQELGQAKEVCQRLGYLPLALQLVGRYVKKHKITLAEMLQRLEEKSLGHPSLIVKENDPTWTLNVEHGVAAAFELSWSDLSDEAQQLGCLLSLFANAPIPWSLVERAAVYKSKKAIPIGLKILQIVGLFKRQLPVKQESKTLEDARVELQSLHLLQGEKIYQLHQLIREFFRNKQKNLATASEQKSQFCQTMLEVAQKIPSSHNQEFISPIKDSLIKDISIKDAIPHLAEVAQNLIDTVSDEDLRKVFLGLNKFYSGQGLYALAQPLCEQCVSVLISRLGEEHTDVAASYNDLAGLYSNQGRYAEAEALNKKALELRERLRIKESPCIAIGYNNLAALYSDQGRYTEAEPLYKKALELTQRLVGEEHHYVAGSYNNLAALYYSQGRYTEAESLCKKALELWQRLLGEEHPDVATSYNNLAALYSDQGRYTEAEPLCKKALELRQRLLGEEHPDIANSYNNLATLYSAQGRYTEAEPLYKKALELRQRLLREEHPDVAISYYSLAIMYSSQGRYTEAEPLCKKALEIAEISLGVDHPNTTKIRKKLKTLGDNYA